MKSCLVDYLIDLMEHLTQVGDPSGFIPGARAHAGWLPFLTKIAREQSQRLRLRPIYDEDDLVLDAESHFHNQAKIVITAPLRTTGGLRLDRERGKSWNWGVLRKTTKQGIRRTYAIRKLCEGRELDEVIETVAEVFDSAWMCESDPVDCVVLQALVRRRWMRASSRSLSLKGEPNIEAAARQYGLPPSETVAGVTQRFRKTILASATVDRRWARKVLSYIERPWTF